MHLAVDGLFCSSTSSHSDLKAHSRPEHIRQPAASPHTHLLEADLAVALLVPLIDHVGHADVSFDE